MGVTVPFKAVKLFCGLIFSRSEDYLQVKEALADHYSAIDHEMAAVPFNHTTYYNEEMGDRLLRAFVSFKALISPEELPKIKLACNDLETRYTSLGKRRINIDPGYISEANVIIATSKNYYHRVPLNLGIYAHMEYVWKKGIPEPLPWTYPDFREPAYIDFFRRIRELYRSGLKSQ